MRLKNRNRYGIALLQRANRTQNRRSAPHLPFVSNNASIVVVVPTFSLITKAVALRDIFVVRLLEVLHW